MCVLWSAATVLCRPAVTTQWMSLTFKIDELEMASSLNFQRGMLLIVELHCGQCRLWVFDKSVCNKKTYLFGSVASVLCWGNHVTVQVCQIKTTRKLSTCVILVFNNTVITVTCFIHLLGFIINT